MVLTSPAGAIVHLAPFGCTPGFRDVALSFAGALPSPARARFGWRSVNRLLAP